MELNHIGARSCGSCLGGIVCRVARGFDEEAFGLDDIAVPADAKYGKLTPRVATLELELTTWGDDRRKLLDRDIGPAPGGQKDNERNSSTRHGGQSRCAIRILRHYYVASVVLLSNNIRFQQR